MWLRRLSTSPAPRIVRTLHLGLSCGMVTPLKWLSGLEIDHLLIDKNDEVVIAGTLALGSRTGLDGQNAGTRIMKHEATAGGVNPKATLHTACLQEEVHWLHPQPPASTSERTLQIPVNKFQTNSSVTR